MMKNNFKEYLDFVEFIQKKGAVYLTEDFSWIDSIKNALPRIGLDLPTTEKRAKIESVQDKKNPIAVQLSDGSKLYFTLDEYKRIDGKPEAGKTMIVRFQRLHNDTTKLPSQISYCRVI